MTYLTTLSIKIRTISTTAYYCLKATCSWGRVLSRPKADKLIRDWATRIIKIIKAKITLHNPHHVDLGANKRYIIMCNHTSLFDIPLTYAALSHESIRMLAKKELTRIPVFNRAIIKTQTPTIDRHNRTQAIKDLEKTKHLMDDGYILWIAPEGTRSLSGVLKPFKKGGFITAIDVGAHIVPLAISHAHKLYDYKTSHFKLNQAIDITLGEPIDASQFSLDEKDKLKALTFKRMNALLAKEQQAK